MRGSLKILFVVNDPAFFLSHRLPLAREARARGYDVHVATPEGESVAQILEEGVSFHPIPLSKHGTDILQELRTMGALFHLFRLLRPDLTHLVTIKPVLYGGVMARLAKVPETVGAITGLGYLFVGAGLKVSILRRLAEFAYRIALGHPSQRAIFQNADDRAYFVERKLISEDRAALIRGSGVDMNLFSPSPEPPGAPIVLMAGRMLREKGVVDFVEAARRLRRSGVGARFVLAGESVPWNRSSVPPEQLARWHEEGVVEYWGRKDDMPDVFARSALVCLPSYGEGVPKCLIEAAACGRPVVTTDTPGCREIVRDGVNGLLVPARDPESLAGALARLLEDPGLRLEMGGAGRELVESEFSVKKVVEETFSLYDRMVSRTD